MKQPQKRELVELIKGNKYYVSFDGKTAQTCTLQDVRTRPDSILVYCDKTKTDHVLYKDEIGNTPEHAIKNFVTN